MDRLQREGAGEGGRKGEKERERGDRQTERETKKERQTERQIERETGRKRNKQKRDLGGVYTRTILRKTFRKRLLCSLYRSIYTDSVSYARNGFNEYDNAGSLVSVGRGLSKTKEKSRAVYESCRFEPFSPFTRGKGKVRSGTVFEVHAFVSGFEVAVFIARFRRISVNEQPKR